MKSQSGIATIDAVGICDIIKACGEHKVRVFEHGSLRISFLDEPQAPEYTIPNITLTSEEETSARIGSKQETIDFAEFESEALLLTNPEAYEDAEAGIETHE